MGNHEYIRAGCRSQGHVGKDIRFQLTFSALCARRVTERCNSRLWRQDHFSNETYWKDGDYHYTSSTSRLLMVIKRRLWKKP
jgi:hypothetical protein